MINRDIHSEFRKFAVEQPGVTGSSVDDYAKIHGYITPYIIEERKMNVASMDVFSRLMMDRIIFLGFLLATMYPILLRHNYFF